MFKSIFSKYFAVISSIIVISFFAMQGAQLFLTSRYWLEEKHTLLEEHAQVIAEHTASSVEIRPSQDGIVYHMEKATLTPFIKLLSMSLDCTVVITNSDGSVMIMCDERGDELPVDTAHTVGDFFQSADGKAYYGVSTLNGLYAERQYTAGVSIRRDKHILGYVFVSLPANGLWEYLKSNLQISFIAALGVLTLTFIALYIMTERLVRPLRAMAKATRSFAQGDFSVRVPVSGKDETAELARALNSMALSLSSVENMRRSFVANVSHELRTPMTTIAGFIDGILDGTVPPEKHAFYLKIVTDEVKRLSRLVHSMLALSRIDSGQLKLNTVELDMVALTGQTLLNFEKRIDEKHITVTGLDDVQPLVVKGDFDLLGQVLYNLFDNAVKFTNDGGELHITLYKENDRVYCGIRNTGAGIPAEEMPRIFERFYKSDRSRGIDKNGVGLGLYIVQTVIALHHGEVMVRSKENESTEFRFWLPA
ncbi:MAG: HAMP domain-containing histidine kinase [Clostridia bacterium]|nr:HAMP domain-containing histidine kinase [Clostridia bacterium]